MDTKKSNQGDINQSQTPLQSTALMASTAPTFLSLTPETSVAAMTEEIARLAKLANLDVSLEPKAVPKIPLKNPKACFRGVPQEVRNMVYEYLLVDPISQSHRLNQ